MNSNCRQPKSFASAIGNRIRRTRILRGWSQSKLGQELGVSFQQIQKYESGASQLSASRLVMLSEVLQVPVSFFVQGRQMLAQTSGLSDEFNPEPLPADIIQAFLAIDDLSIRTKLLELLQAIAVVCSSTAEMR
ncbi:helix-turn-helix transcriptional regulator (plasmid) [Rhizobium lusitanum]|uniref:helix-turn-helix domain-containing protein n=1 Tax=Rhizobium lusitanum TaxID=293958 RepID=UPI001613DF51|nr:helix-turn-helix transcriptional regulator [Rhizobium lusitanum]QND44430.1 helix-turn-helix transcriptional regulator [Rhizobium lusitanum]